MDDYMLDFCDISKLPDQSLAVIQCGYQESHSGYKSVLRKYNDYSVTFILEGKGTYTLNGTQYEICAGQGFLIVPNAQISYVADPKQPWKYIYAIFRGMDSEALIRNAGISYNSPIFIFNPEEMIPILYNMHKAGKEQRAMGYDVTAFFMLAMSFLVRDAVPKRMIRDCQEEYMERALSYIKDHYPYHISISDIAKYVSIDRTYLYKIFKQRFNVSPTQFLNEYRLAKAVEMMQHPKATISEISYSCGFCSPSHFNSSFWRKYGITPGKYRIQAYEQYEK